MREVDGLKPSPRVEFQHTMDLRKRAAQDLRRRALEVTPEQIQEHAGKPLIERVLSNKDLVENAAASSPALQELLRKLDPIVFLQGGLVRKVLEMSDRLAISNTGLRFQYVNLNDEYREVDATDEFLKDDVQNNRELALKFGNMDPRAVLGQMARATQPSLPSRLLARYRK